MNAMLAAVVLLGLAAAAYAFGLAGAVVYGAIQFTAYARFARGARA
jgi:hypothetical protein